ncbi:MAG TPA: putative sulfate exporter family transporter [Reyranella sp.]|nr:putative sulfate exporter family transporter [Reyranella sp.]
MNPRADAAALSLTGASWLETSRALLPGVLVSAVLAIAAAFLSQHYGAPVMLLALLLGMAMNFLATDGACGRGIDFTARTVLRLGVALLGLRITLSQIAALGWQPVALVLLSVGLTIAAAILAARLLGFRVGFGVLSGGATAICGASAALTIAAALPNHPLKQRATLFVVLGVSALSTFAMIAYPMLAQAIGLDGRQAGIFLGATIHDVAQVVGAGYGMSTETGDIATFVKLLRVAMLLPVIAITAVSYRKSGADAGGARLPLLPGFAVGFAVLVALNSMDVIPSAVAAWGSEVSRWCLVAAVAALGTKTRLRELATIGFKPVALLVGETAFLAALVLVLLGCRF